MNVPVDFTHRLPQSRELCHARSELNKANMRVSMLVAYDAFKELEKYLEMSSDACIAYDLCA